MPFKFDANNNLDVNLAAGSISGGNAAASPTGVAVPASADYIGFSQSGTLVGVDQTNRLPTTDKADDTTGAEANATFIKIGGILAAGSSAQPCHISAAGNLNVNLAEGSISGGNAAAGLTGAAVPTSADYTGFNSGGNLVGVSTAAPLPVAQQGAVTLGAGAAVIGHVIADTGSTTAVTGNVTVIQGTGTNLHVVVDTAPSTVVTQATGTNLHTVVDSGSITANAGTNLNTSALLLDATFTGRINTLGSKVSASSTPVVIASDQASIPVTGTFFQGTQPVSGTVTANIGTTGGLALDASLTTLDTDLKATQPRDITDRAARLLGHVTVDSAPTTAVTGTFFQATQPVSAVSLPLPANAAQETGGNLASILAQQALYIANTRNDAQILDVLNCILAQLKLLNMNLASSMPSAHVDADTWIMDVLPVLN